MTEPSDDCYDASIEGFPTSADEENLRARLPVELLASQFVDELRAGRNPSIDDYASRYSRIAGEIREYFPVLRAMEELKQKKQTDNLRESVPEQFEISELGSCHMLREIGRGGMGVVFEAVEHSGRRVAVKLLPWHTAGIPGWRERFEREARTTQRMAHPNIVPIHRTGTDGGYCYFVMDLVAGVGLDWIVSRLAADHVVRPEDVQAASYRPRTVTEIDTDCEIPIELLGELEDATGQPDVESTPPLTLHAWIEFGRIIQQAVQALGYAHGRGVLHNDVKPGNLLVNARWKVWMTDFGLAQPIDSIISDDERLVGTLRYMAPERLRGEQTVQTDVYSLGLTLYELVTQTPAFSNADREELADCILSQEPARPRDINHSIPSELEAVILNAIAPDLTVRYASAAEFSADVVRFLKGLPVHCRTDRPSRFGFLRRGQSS